MRKLVLLLVLVICFVGLSGCRHNAELSGMAEDTEQYTRNPEDTSSSLETTPKMLGEVSKITELPWDSGRANVTSGNRLWEVEQGYYLEWDYLLYYADKSDLSLWIPVCSEPDCEHDPNSPDIGACDANVACCLLLKGDRIYFDTNSKKTLALQNTGLYSTFIGSMALDGTDKRLEYYIPEAEKAFQKGDMFTNRAYLLTDCFVYSTAVMNQQGTNDFALYLTDKDGTILLFETTKDNNALGGMTSRSTDLYGDEGFFEYAVEENSNILYRIRDRQLYGVDLTDVPWNGGYIEENLLLTFCPGDGYYQIDLQSGQKSRVEDRQMDNSFCHIIAPNCILESTVLCIDNLWDAVLETRQTHPTEEHTMRFFDGEQWRDVVLPDEVSHAQVGECLVPIGLTSDRILLSFEDISVVPNENPAALYQILLNTDTPTLEYLGTIG